MSDKDLLAKGEGALAPTAEEIDARLAQMRIAAAENEERVVICGCAATGGNFLVRFKRKAPGQRFAVAAIEKQTSAANAAPSGVLFRRAGVPAKTYSWDEFDIRGLACPYCGNKGPIIYCEKCRREMCGARYRDLSNGRGRFHCADSCGESFPTIRGGTIRAASRTAPPPAITAPAALLRLARLRK